MVLELLSHDPHEIEGLQGLTLAVEMEKWLKTRNEKTSAFDDPVHLNIMTQAQEIKRCYCGVYKNSRIQGKRLCEITSET